MMASMPVFLSVPLYQFPGSFFDVVRAISGRSRLLARVSVPVLSRAFPSVLCAFLPALVRALSFLKRRGVMLPPLPAPSHSSSHPIQSPRFSPRLSTRVAWRVSFACRVAVGAGGRSCCLSGCGVSSSHRPSVRLVRPSFSVISCSFPSLSSCVMPWSHLIISSSHRLSSRSLDTAGGERVERSGRCLGVGWCYRVRTVWYYLESFSTVVPCCLLRRRVFYRLRLVSRSVPLPVSLLFVIRPVLRHGERGDVLRGLSDGFVARSRCLPSLERGIVFAWRVIISGRSRRGCLCGLCVWGDCLLFLWYICLVS